MKYIYISADAIELFATIRQYQNIDFPEGESLHQILTDHSTIWNDTNILIHRTIDGIIFYTHKLDRNRGLLFDCTTFNAFAKQPNDKIITIFQKTIKYAIKYFNKLALAPCESEPNAATAIIYPFPFLATKNVYKILIDKNTSKHNREVKNILTAFYSGCESNKQRVSFTTLNKALTTISLLSTPTIENAQKFLINSYSSTHLEDIVLSLDANIGYDNWREYLTNTQKSFVFKPINGVERLEGAAGTGKTLSMILRCIYLLKTNKNQRIIFVTHSKATRDHICLLLPGQRIDLPLDPDGVHDVAPHDEQRGADQESFDVTGIHRLREYACIYGSEERCTTGDAPWRSRR